jgi:hypothetical protein
MNEEQKVYKIIDGKKVELKPEEINHDEINNKLTDIIKRVSEKGNENEPT